MNGCEWTKETEGIKISGFIACSNKKKRYSKQQWKVGQVAVYIDVSSDLTFELLKIAISYIIHEKQYQN